MSGGHGAEHGGGHGGADHGGGHHAAPKKAHGGGGGHGGGHGGGGGDYDKFTYGATAIGLGPEMAGNVLRYVGSAADITKLFPAEQATKIAASSVPGADTIPSVGFVSGAILLFGAVKAAFKF